MSRRRYRTEVVELDGQQVEQFVLPISGGRRARVPATWPAPARPEPKTPEPDALFAVDEPTES